MPSPENTRKCIFYTLAYNAEKTLPRAIDSILAQTHDNWLYYIVDNGSTDITGKVIGSYAKQDSRIIPLRNKENFVWEPGNAWGEVISQQKDDEYFCMLDADDEYAPVFLERMLGFVVANTLDVACCGNDFIDALTNKLQRARILKHNLILEGNGFSAHFPTYHQFTRTLWAKLFSVSLLLRCDFKGLPVVYYGKDTLMVQEICRHAARVGILAESLHKYYVSPKSASYYLDEHRINADRILDDFARQFLIDKCGAITSQNDHFLSMIYFNAIKDTLNVLFGAQISVSEKLAGLHNIFTSEHTRRLIAWQGYIEEKKKLFENIANWVLSQKECLKPEGAKIAAEVLWEMYKHALSLVSVDSLEYLILTMRDIVKPVLGKDYVRIIERIQSWYKRHDNDNIILTEMEIAAYRALNKANDELFALLTDIKKKRPNASEKLNIEMQIGELLSQYPLFKNVSAGLAYAFARTVRRALKKDFVRALEGFISVSRDFEVADEDAEAYILLGINLSAAAENTYAYIYFKKVWISYLLDCSRIEEASKELDEFEQILPDDEDFIELRRRLEH